MEPARVKLITAKHLVAVVSLLAILLGLYAFLQGRRAQKDVMETMRQQGVALATALEISSRNAISGNRLVEEMISQRLLDNARLLDQLLASQEVGWQDLPRVARENGLYKIEVRDLEGQLVADSQKPPAAVAEAPPFARRPGMMGRMMGPGGQMMPGPSAPELRARIRQHMRGMFFEPIITGKAQEAVKGFGEKKFWRGAEYGVAIKRRYAPGLIVILAEAKYILNFRQEIGVQRLINDLKGKPGVEYISLQDKDGVYLAHSDPERVGEKGQETDASSSTRVRAWGQGKVLEVTTPLSLGETSLGIIKVGLSLAPVEALWRKSLYASLFFGLALLSAGIAGAVVIFLNQRRHVEACTALEERVRRSQRLASLGNLAAGVAHEVRNPLNAIALGIQRLKKEFIPKENKEAYEKFIEVIRGEVVRLNGIVDRLLELARPSKALFVSCDASQLTAEVLALIKGEFEAKGIQLKADIPSASFAIIADGPKLKQALMNMLLNALQATPAGGTVTVTLEQRKGECRLEVKDTGPGIDPDKLEQIFDPYFTTKEKGMGLGLYVAQEIVQEHGGRLEVKSQPGQGASFILVIPTKGEMASGRVAYSGY